MRTIHKFPFKYSDDPIIVTGYRINVVLVAPNRDDERTPCVWVEYEPVPETVGCEKATFIYIGTGHRVPDGYDHVGSAVCSHDFVWHVYAQISFS